MKCKSSKERLLLTHKNRTSVLFTQNIVEVPIKIRVEDVNIKEQCSGQFSVTSSNSLYFQIDL